MPEWTIASQEYFVRLGLAPESFRQRLRLPKVEDVRQIIPLRDMRSIESLTPIPMEFLVYLLHHIRTVDNAFPFADSRIRILRMDPRLLKIGQRFVYRENYQGILEQMSAIFQEFAVTNGGVSDLGAYFVFGKDAASAYCMACYLPPIIEKHGPDLVVMDGIHRNWSAMQTGANPFVILIEDVAVPFPCTAHEWSDIQVISLSAKPKDIEKRYFGIAPKYFRDLKFLGIDG